MTFLRSRLGLAVLIWAGTVSGGFLILGGYGNSPGSSSAPVTDWPSDSALERSGAGFELVMFVHPHCPCSRASLRELERLVARCRDRVRVRLAFVAPHGTDPGWRRTSLRANAAGMTGIEIIDDHAGLEARRFGARTSGQVYLFDPSGKLRFSGGITASRGHEGDNLGGLSIIDVIAGRTPRRPETGVFGCKLLDETGIQDTGENSCCPQR